MADIRKSVLIEYSDAQMYELVTNVKEYPQFLPWCSGVEVLMQTETELEARIDVNFKGIKTFFHTRNDQQRPHRIEMKLVDGPFQKFLGSWHFTALDIHACKIEFHLHYEFSNLLLEKVIGPVFSMIANTFIDGFVKRAHHIYQRV